MTEVPNGAVLLDKDSKRALIEADKAVGIRCSFCGLDIHEGLEFVFVDMATGPNGQRGAGSARAFICDRKGCDGKRAEFMAVARAFRPIVWFFSPDPGESSFENPDA